MTAPGAAMLDQKQIEQVEDMTGKKWTLISVERPALTLYERELKLYCI